VGSKSKDSRQPLAVSKRQKKVPGSMLKAKANKNTKATFADICHGLGGGPYEPALSDSLKYRRSEMEPDIMLLFS
jgi:hypothetical protein